MPISSLPHPHQQRPSHFLSRAVLAHTFIALACLFGVSTSSAWAQATTIFEDDFETGSFRAEWTARPGIDGDGASDGIVVVANDLDGLQDIARSDEYAAALGKSADGEVAVNALDLQLDLSGQTDVELLFWLYDRRDETDSGDGLYFSSDGSEPFVKVLDFDGSTWNNDFYGQLPPIDVDRLATENGLELTDQFVIRFQQEGSGDFNTIGQEDGFIIDDVLVRSRPVEFATLPFEDEFEDGSFGLSWRRATPLNTCLNDPCETVNILGGLVDITAQVEGLEVARRGLNAVVLGRRNDGPETTNALDLHLNLSGQTDVELLFWLYDRRDETDNEDGLFFSDDGGETFEKVLSLDGSNWNDDFYGQLPPIDVDRLAAEKELELTNQFVIRFQQQGSGDFNTIGQEDGFIIDDVLVRPSPVEFARPTPEASFMDGFEDGTFGTAWSVGTASRSVALGSEATTRLGGLVDVTAEVEGLAVARSGLNAAVLGRRNDGQETATALDLHLNLEDLEGVGLTFWIADRSDETDLNDYILFSDNGGERFEQVFELTPSDWTDLEFQQIVLDVSALANNEGLSLTDQFVIRFQQQGNGDFNTIGREDGFIIDDVTVSVDRVIPVELTSFTAFSDDDAIRLNWSTASETNNAGFDIERSTDGASFARIGFEEGVGTTTEAQSYQFSDTAPPFASTLYYRLRQVDVDGAFEYSPVVEVAMTPSSLALLPSAPNPFRQSTVLRYEIPEPSVVRLQVFDAVGRHVATLADGEQSAGRHELTFDGSRLASGTYFVRLEVGANVQTQMMRLVR
jgi:hypothetical protein